MNGKGDKQRPRFISTEEYEDRHDKIFSNSIDWVIEATGNDTIKKGVRESHKYDEIRADQDIKWCPKCKRKWEIYEGELWASRDRKLFYEEKICIECDTPVK